jgi:HK97 family phage prohead protease
MDPILLSKNYSATAEATEDGPPGEFTALVSAFGNEDSQGDIVEKGAFTNTLKEWDGRGRPIPVVWAHKFDDPEMFLGHYTAAQETDAGLQLTGLLDLEHPKAERVHKLMKSGLVVEFSISGLVRDYELIEKDDDEGEDDWGWFAPMRIKDIDLWEAGPCFKGANANTELLSIKSLATRVPVLRKEGRVLAQRHVDSLKEAHQMLGDIITAVEKQPDPEQPGPAGKARNPGMSPNVRALLDLNTIH